MKKILIFLLLLFPVLTFANQYPSPLDAYTIYQTDKNGNEIQIGGATNDNLKKIWKDYNLNSKSLYDCVKLADPSLCESIIPNSYDDSEDGYNTDYLPPPSGAPAPTKLKPIVKFDYKFKDIWEMQTFLSAHFKYKMINEDNITTDNWQDPQTTKDTQDQNGFIYGDCEDFSFLVVDILKKDFNIDGYTLIVGNHAVPVWVKSAKARDKILSRIYVYDMFSGIKQFGASTDINKLLKQIVNHYRTWNDIDWSKFDSKTFVNGKLKLGRLPEYDGDKEILSGQSIK